MAVKDEEKNITIKKLTSIVEKKMHAVVQSVI
jgi:hypothetical protein